MWFGVAYSSILGLMLPYNDFLDEGNFTRSFVRGTLLAVSGIDGLKVSVVEKLAILAGVYDLKNLKWKIRPEEV